MRRSLSGITILAFLIITSMLPLYAFAKPHAQPGEGILGQENPRVVSLTADIERLDLTANDSGAAISITALYSDNSTEDVTARAEWHSSNTKVAAVSAGIVTPVGKGKTVISAKFDGKKVSIKVVVTPPIESLVLTETQTTMTVGRADKLNAIAYYQDGSRAVVTGKPGVAWSVVGKDGTDVASVVTVSKGVLKAVGTGQAVVKAAYKGQTAACKVLVTTTIDSLTANPVELIMGIDDPDQSIQLIANYVDGSSDNIADYAVWTSSDPQIVTVINGIVTPVGVGAAYVTADYNGKTAVIPVTVNPDPDKNYGVIKGFTIFDGEEALLILAPDGTQQVLRSEEAGVVATVVYGGTETLAKGQFIQYTTGPGGIEEIVILASPGKVSDQDITDLNEYAIAKAQYVRVESLTSQTIKGKLVDGINGTIATTDTYYVVNADTIYFDVSDTSNLKVTSGVDVNNLVLMIDTDDDGRAADYVIVVAKDYPVEFTWMP